MASFGTVMGSFEKLRLAALPYARSIAALIAGIAITFTDDHSTYLGLEWLTFIVIVSLVLRDGPATAMNAFAWWSTLVVVAMTVLGLLVGRMSPATALSLTIALVAFETSRAFTRGDRIWLWSTGTLAVGLTVLYFSIDANDRTAAGLTGGWAVIAGVFGLIGAVDTAIKKSRAKSNPKSSPKSATQPTPRQKSSTPTAARKTAPASSKAKPRGSKR